MAITNLAMKVLIFSVIVSSVFGQGFTPGCSFFNGQCVYNVKLGHEQQCDAVGSSGSQSSSDKVSVSGNLDSSGGCSCNDVKKMQTEIGSIKTTLGNLQASIKNLNTELNLTQTNLVQTGSQLQQQNTLEKQLLADLNSKEQMLNQSKEELANVLLLAKSEIDSMREQLINATRDLSTCQGNLGITPSSKPAVTADYSTFYCGFETHQGMCNFTQTTRSELDSWVMGSDRKYSSTGPEMDHTYGTPSGKYMYINAEYVAQHHTSSTTITMRMTSQTFDPAPHYCIRFWYNMHGTHTKAIKVYAKINGGVGYPSLSLKPQNSVDWKLAEVELDAEYTATPFQVMFEGSTNAYHKYTYTNGYSHQLSVNPEGNVALDDIYIYNTTCNSVPACPPTAYTRQNEDNTTSCYTFHTKPASWYDASIACKRESHKGHLATVTSSAEQNFLVNLIQSNNDLLTAGHNGFYIGGSDEKTESNFVWTNTQSGHVEPLNYTNWHTGQPNDVGGIQDCIVMLYPATNYDWGDVTCTESHPFICEATQ